MSEFGFTKDSFEWRAKASCMGAGNIFFGPTKEREVRRHAREEKARAICAACPVIDVCREYAYTYRVDGVWGGENEEDRLRADPLVPLTTYALRMLKLIDDPVIVQALSMRNDSGIKEDN